MNTEELKALLLREGFPPGWFSVDGEWLEEGHILLHSGREWKLKYIEKGYAKEIGRFSTEESACAAMYDEMRKAWPEPQRSDSKDPPP